MLGIAVTYSVISLRTTDELDYSVPESIYSTSSDYENEQENTNKIKNTNFDTKNSESNLSNEYPKHNPINVNSELPFTFSVVGIAKAKELENYNNDKESLVLIQFENELFEHQLHDFILNTDMQLVKIEAQQISIEYKDTIYIIALTPPNILAEDFRTPDKPYAELIEMTADEIGSRPRIMEHLIKLTPTPYIANGAIVSPGLNPSLFEQAGFKADDVLKSINGKSVTVESELEDIKKELKSAQTLTFLVMRKGRIVTLYLDIPSETLELSRE